MDAIFTVDADDLRCALHACQLAMAGPNDRPDLAEIWAERRMVEKVRFVATDGKRVHVVTVRGLWFGERATVRFPADAVKLIPGVLRRSLNALADTCLHGDEERVARVSVGRVAMPGGNGLNFHPSGFDEVPEIDRVLGLLDSRRGDFVPSLNPKYMADAGIGATRVREGRLDVMRVESGSDGEGPVSFTMSTEHREFLAVVMPMRVDAVG